MIHFVTLEYAVAMKDTKKNMENVGWDLEILPEQIGATDYLLHLIRF